MSLEKHKIRNYIIKYILLNIQSQKWKEGKKLPSERQISIKFNVSRSLVSNIFTLFKTHNIIYSVPNKGNYIVPKKYSYLFSESTISDDVTTKFLEDAKISEEDWSVFKKIKNEEQVIFDSIKNDPTVFAKKYYQHDVLIKSLIVFFPNKMKLKEGKFNKELVETSIYNILAWYGISLGKCISISSLTYNNNNNYIFLDDEKSDAVVNSNYKIFIGMNNEVQAVVKIVSKLEIGVPIKVRKIDLFSS